jgi:hypothetical protein
VAEGNRDILRVVSGCLGDSSLPPTEWDIGPIYTHKPTSCRDSCDLKKILLQSFPCHKALKTFIRP